MTLFQCLHMPALDGASGWLNSAPIDTAGLRGRVVLVDFWTFTCINWLRTEPYIRAWANAYHDDGLTVIGVHTPEFSFEHERDRVQQQTKRLAIDYPIALDNNYAIWNAFANSYWPAVYLVDRDGFIRSHHFGEGRYEESEREIQRLLGVERDLTVVRGEGIEAEADWSSLRSPETYLGSARGQRGSPPPHLALNRWSTVGEWQTAPDKIVLEKAGGSIAFRFHARDVHLVLSRRVKTPVPFRVLVDNQSPRSSHGVDVDAQGFGLLDDGRLYQLVRQSDRIVERTIEITFDSDGAEAYAFTFG